MCADSRYEDRACKSDVFRDALRKETPDNDSGQTCLPGERWCTGFQAMFGGPKSEKSENCLPWDFDCALKDYFKKNVEDQELKVKYPLLYYMPKTTLTKEENDAFIANALLLDMEIWSIGLNQQTLT